MTTAGAQTGKAHVVVTNTGTGSTRDLDANSEKACSRVVKKRFHGVERVAACSPSPFKSRSEGAAMPGVASAQNRSATDLIRTGADLSSAICRGTR
jgi:hypothetical protein